MKPCGPLCNAKICLLPYFIPVWTVVLGTQQVTVCWPESGGGFPACGKISGLCRVTFPNARFLDQNKFHPHDTMAQTTTIETVTITRPLKVIAFVCGVIVILLMIMGLASTDWLMALGWRQGLFAHCIEDGAPTPLPFHMTTPAGCYQARDVGYIKAAAALCVVCLLADIAATILTGLGLRSQDHRDKHKYYLFAVFCMGLALAALLIALVVYPVCFAAELNHGNRTMWEFGWAYGVGWGAAIFLFGGAVLLLCDKESEEIYYKERKIVRDDIGGGGGSMIGVGHHGVRSGTQLA